MTRSDINCQKFSLAPGNDSTGTPVSFSLFPEQLKHTFATNPFSSETSHYVLNALAKSFKKAGSEQEALRVLKFVLPQVIYSLLILDNPAFHGEHRHLSREKQVQQLAQTINYVSWPSIEVKKRVKHYTPYMKELNRIFDIKHGAVHTSTKAKNRTAIRLFEFLLIELKNNGLKEDRAKELINGACQLMESEEVCQHRRQYPKFKDRTEQEMQIIERSIPSRIANLRETFLKVYAKKQSVNIKDIKDNQLNISAQKDVKPQTKFDAVSLINFIKKERQAINKLSSANVKQAGNSPISSVNNLKIENILFSGEKNLEAKQRALDDEKDRRMFEEQRLQWEEAERNRKKLKKW